MVASGHDQSITSITENPTLKNEIVAMARFAFPIVFAQAGFMFMGVVDTAMLGRIGPAEVAGAGVARSLFWLVAIFLIGIISALDIVASQALGAQRRDDLTRILFDGVKFAIWLSIIGTPLLFLASHALILFDYEAKILASAQIYLNTISLGLPFILIFTAIQRYWQSVKQTRIIVVITIVANIINYAVNSVLIFGKFGVPALGVTGAGFANTIARAAMCVMIVFFTFRHLRSQSGSRHYFKTLAIDKRFLKTMLRFGIPAGAHQAFEVSAFSLITLLAAKLLAIESAAHQIVLIITSFAYMFPVGFANASAYRVGHFVGEGNYYRAHRAGNAAIVLGMASMFIAACLLLLCSQAVLPIFTADLDVIGTAKSILFYAAALQVFDAMQACSIGALRGAGNTVYASILSAVGFYGVTLPLGSFLCFSQDLRLVGLWIGLMAGLMVIGIGAVYVWLTIKPVSLVVGDMFSSESADPP